MYVREGKRLRQPIYRLYQTKNGCPAGSMEIIAGNHNDACDLGKNLRKLFKDLKQREPFSGSYLDADSAFDTKGARKISFDNGVIPNMAENRRYRKKPKRGRKRLFCLSAQIPFLHSGFYSHKMLNHI